MRTTVTIDDALLKRAKELAARSGRPLGAIVDEGLRVLLAERPATAAAIDLPTYGGSGLQPGVDLDDKDALMALLEEDSGRAAG
jgi:hypothetical protein